MGQPNSSRKTNFSGANGGQGKYNFPCSADHTLLNVVTHTSIYTHTYIHAYIHNTYIHTYIHTYAYIHCKYIYKHMQGTKDTV